MEHHAALERVHAAAQQPDPAENSSERALLASLRDAAAAVMASKKQSSAATGTAVLMELKGKAEALRQRVAESDEAEESAKKRAAEVDEELRVLKYQCSRLRASIGEQTHSTPLLELDDVVSIEEAHRIAAARSGGSGNRSSDPSATAHQQTLFRLGVERDERVRLCGVRDELAARRKKLGLAAAAATELKGSVDSQVEAVVSAAAGLSANMPPHAAPKASGVASASFASQLPQLPPPLYTLAIGLCAYATAHELHVTLSITGDNAAAAPVAQPSDGPASGAAASPQPWEPITPAAAVSADLGAHALCVRLAVKSTAGAKAVSVQFRYHEAIGVLTAAAEPKAADGAVRGLGGLLDAAAVASAGGAPTEQEGTKGASTAAPAVAVRTLSAAAGPVAADDGSSLPDRSTALRARRGRGADGSTTSEASALGALLPGRPYRWLQALGGLGPLLTSPPQPSQLVFQALLQALTSC